MDLLVLLADLAVVLVLLTYPNLRSCLQLGWGSISTWLLGRISALCAGVGGRGIAALRVGGGRIATLCGRRILGRRRIATLSGGITTLLRVGGRGIASLGWRITALLGRISCTLLRGITWLLGRIPALLLRGITCVALTGRRRIRHMF